jgi:hypothetical protein
LLNKKLKKSRLLNLKLQLKANQLKGNKVKKLLSKERDIEAIDQKVNIDQETTTENLTIEMVNHKLKAKKEVKEEDITTITMEKEDKDLTTDQNKRTNLKLVKKIQIHH